MTDLELTYDRFGVDIARGLIVIEGEEFGSYCEIEKRFGERFVEIAKKQTEIEYNDDWRRFVKSDRHPENVAKRYNEKEKAQCE